MRLLVHRYGCKGRQKRIDCDNEHCHMVSILATVLACAVLEPFMGLSTAGWNIREASVQDRKKSSIFRHTVSDRHTMPMTMPR
jgi:hypothetical protein